jgi:ABC-type lipoprotein release transport system permease subunit
MGPLSLARMAWRNLWRHRRRTLITAFSIAFAFFLAVLIIGMNDGSWEEVINTAARIGGGHITVQHPEYQDKPALSRTVRNTAQKIARLQQIDHVVKALPRVVGQTMLATSADSFGAGFIAYDPALEGPESLSILEAVSEGELFETSTDKGIILGDRLARNLDAEMGSKVVYTLTDKSGEIVSGLARVSGLVHTGSPAVDLGLCFLPLDAVRATLGYEADEAVQVAVFVDSQRRSDDMIEAVAATLDDGSVALSWKEIQPDLNSFILMKRGGGAFFAMLILLLCAAGIFNTLFVSVMERMREFGILMAIGFSQGRLVGLVIWESLWLGLVGLAGGVLLTAYPYYYLATTGIDMTEIYASGEQSADVAGVAMSLVIKIGLYPESLVLIALIALAATMLSGLYPAYKAGTVEPVETIKLV